METLEIPVDAVVFRNDLYPRIETSHETVQRYAEDLDVLPPIEVNQNNELIDGWHRWTGHKKKGIANIRVVVTPTKTDAELLELAIVRNAKHGLQLSREDKRDMARRIYSVTPERERDEKKKQLARILSVSRSTMHERLSRIDKDSKAAREKRIFEMWMTYHSMQEIADAVGIHKDTVSEICRKFPELENSDKVAADHATDFDPPLYNVWKQQEKTGGSKHFGNSEVRWVDNLLYRYTAPFDVVVDPFAGGGSTIDICKKRFRRYWVSDRKPIVERAHEIREHDLTNGLPPLPRWQDVKLVYLDPPYWKQAEGEYSNEDNDLANMPLEKFTETLAGIINGIAKKLKPGAVIAMLMQPTQWRSPEREYTDHVADMIRIPSCRVTAAAFRRFLAAAFFLVLVRHFGRIPGIYALGADSRTRGGIPPVLAHAPGAHVVER